MAFADCATITLKGILMDCSSSIGGIKRVWLTRYSDIELVAGKTATIGDITETDPETSEVITLGKGVTAITLKSGAEWHPYEFRKNTGSLTSTLNVDTENGNNYITSELSLVFSKMETRKRMEIAALTVGAVVAVVEDSNGKFWLLGYEDYVSASAGTGETGTAKEDRNAYTITLSTDSTEWPYELSAAAAASVTG